MNRRLWPWLLVALLWSSSARADLPSWLRKQNGDITDGNELLSKGDAKAALAAYDRAARELPDNPGVQLNRGIALLKLGELAKAKEALLSATGPSGAPELRADAYRNLALAHYREAEASAGQNQHGPAQEAFRDSVDAAKRSLRLRPGDPNTAWNLELAARRMREEQAKEKAEQEKQKQDEKQDGDKKPQDGEEQAKNEPGQDANKDKAQDKDKQGQDPQQQPKQPQQKPQPSHAQDAQAGQDDKAKGEKPLPSDVAQPLDALQDSEQNFERVRARQRAQQERRAPEKDW